MPQRGSVFTAVWDRDMTGITLHYNPACTTCVRQAQRTASLDWLGRVTLSTARSPLGAVPKGRIVVVDTRDNRVFTGIYATRKVCLQVPLFFPYGLLLSIPRFAGLRGGITRGATATRARLDGLALLAIAIC